MKVRKTQGQEKKSHKKIRKIREKSGSGLSLYFGKVLEYVDAMARKPRVEFAGAFYHVIVRGNQRQNVFRHDQDRKDYLARVEHYRKRYGFSLYAYVLMSNHIHLLLETQSVGLSKIMQGIQFSYTQRYNRRHHTVGHLFQGRYKAIVCDRDVYLSSGV